ncbi:MAG: hypothetical protein ACOX63_12200 [Christensenellales bacterium]
MQLTVTTVTTVTTDTTRAGTLLLHGGACLKHDIPLYFNAFPCNGVGCGWPFREKSCAVFAPWTATTRV